MQLRDGVERRVLCVMQRHATEAKCVEVADADGTGLCGCVSLADFMSQQAERRHSASTTQERAAVVETGVGRIPG